MPAATHSPTSRLVTIGDVINRTLSTGGWMSRNWAKQRAPSISSASGCTGTDGHHNRPQLGEAAGALDFLGLRVHRHRLVIPCLEFAEEHSREVLRMTGDADKRKALLCQKVPDVFHLRHIGSVARRGVA